MDKRPSKRGRNAAVGAVVLIAVLISAFFAVKYFSRPIADKPSSNYSAGVIRLSEVIKLHPRYNDLRKLYDERTAIAAEISKQPGNIPQEKSDNETAEAFSNLAQQKDDMGIRIVDRKLQDELVAREKSLRAQVADPKSAEMKTENDKYENAIFNCSLKLDNAENLRLTPDEIDNLQKEIMRLKKERSAKVRAVSEKYESYIQKELGKYYSDRLNHFKGTLTERDADNLAKADSQKAAFENAREEMIKRQNDEMTDRRKTYLALLKAFDNKNSEINALREIMINDIAAKASKFAVMYHLDIIYADQQQISNDTFLTKDGWDSLFSDQIVTTSSVLDITDDVLKQMQNAG
ncbi:hypothetical protein [Pectinatus haikarae]|uniref:Outer membrane protein (OmpH-like) n=1 Tax=Pectinatus haikarae TaxID=349096 RepID=A0ABT9Y5U0_9FIRM|nr:hypothetical protein [Pectinatus haikarae]MDQ0203081.1 hypothetical protein [Pectinatus haikarae]